MEECPLRDMLSQDRLPLRGWACETNALCQAPRTVCLGGHAPAEAASVAGSLCESGSSCIDCATEFVAARSFVSFAGPRRLRAVMQSPHVQLCTSRVCCDECSEFVPIAGWMEPGRLLPGDDQGMPTACTRCETIHPVMLLMMPLPGSRGKTWTI